MPISAQNLMDKLQSLPAERIAEVDDFIDFICLREQQSALIRAATASSAPAFANIWINPEDDVYDAL